MKQAHPSKIADVSDMLCSRCNRPFDIAVRITPEGEHETFLQCFTCFYSIKLTRQQSRPEISTIH